MKPPTCPFCGNIGHGIKLMQQMFQDYLHGFVLLCLDDIVVFFYFEEHLINLAKFYIVYKDRITSTAKKCHYAQKQIKYLGYVVSSNGIEPVPAKVTTRGYTVTERELLATVWAIKNFRPYIFGSHFELITDHSALKKLMQNKDPHGRLSRSVLTLQEHSFTLKHRAGTTHCNEDALSRLEYPIVNVLSEPAFENNRLHQTSTSRSQNISNGIFSLKVSYTRIQIY